MDFTYILDRLKEKSTWVAIGSFLTAVGVTLKPDQWQMVMAIGMGLPSVIAIFLPAYVQEKNITPALPTAPTTPLAQSLADNVASGQTDTTGAKL